ncbi:MAG: ATP-grasp domain-containing protein [Gammaproteobacteria bacterium]|nr:ATP-grasp domain-containing protein [Gammaproteobacteria bacterium]
METAISHALDHPYLMVIAASARMLAQAARREGYRLLVVDCFGDQDTRCFAEESVCIPDLSDANVKKAINDFKARYPVELGIYGAGFEQHQASLRYLCSQLNVLGNQPDTFANVQDKATFFSSLKKLGIPFPDTTFQVPDHKDGWLIKPLQGQGGMGIGRFINDDNVERPVCWQRYQTGTAHSVLFLADGRRCRIIGFNRQWTVALSESDEFVFSGIINDTELTEKQCELLMSWVKKLTLEFSINGLNSLDFIKNDDEFYVLEINPRPPASMQLYDGDLLSLHMNACHGKPPESFPQQNDVCGLQVVYAQQKVGIPDGFAWPEGCQDIPGSGTLINAGQPICSIINKGNDAAAVMDVLKQRKVYILQHLQ